MGAVAGAGTRLAFRAAVEARDLDAVVDSFAPDAIVRGPNSDRLVIRGHEEIRALYRVNLEVIQELEFTDELRSGDTAVVVGRARVDGTEIEVADHLRLDEHGKVRELTVFFRPLPAIAVATRAFSAALGRRRSPLRGTIMSLLGTPFVVQTRSNDRLSVRFMRAALRWSAAAEKRA